MADSTLWWLAAGTVVGIELLTGTFYLLMLAMGLAAGALAAHTGASLVVQLVVAALVGGGAVAISYHLKKRRLSDPSARADRSVNLDVGEIIHIEAWNPDGSASVQYRGANWTAIHQPGITPSAGAHRVCELVGSRLLVEKI